MLESWGAIIGILGLLAGSITAYTTWWLGRRAKREDAHSDATLNTAKARIDDSAALRGEIWIQYNAAIARNDELSRLLGVETQARAGAQATSETQARQILGLEKSLAEAVNMRDEYQQRLQRKFDESDTTRAILSDVRSKLDDCEREVHNLKALTYQRRNTDQNSDEATTNTTTNNQ